MFVPVETANYFVSFLAQQGVISSSDLSRVLSAATEGGDNAINLVFKFSLADEASMATSVANAFGLELADLSEEQSVDTDALVLLPRKFITQNRVLPFSKDGSTLHVAIADPAALNQMSSVHLVTGLTVVTHVVKLSELDRWLNRFSGEGLTTDSIEHPLAGDSAPSKQKKKAASAKKPSDLTTQSDDAGNVEGADEAKSSEVIQFVNDVISTAIQLHVSDIHLEPYRDAARLRYRLDGVLQVQEKLSKFLLEHYPAISTRIKIMSKLDIAERRLPQDGAITFKTGDGREVDLRVSVLPTSAGGERIVMRLLDHSAFELKLDTLGMHDADLGKLTTAVDAPQGLVLVTGPTGSGKSTTLYACLNRINKDGINIMTAEDPVEYVMEGVGQVQIRDDIGLDFKAALRSFLRQDPEVILVGEIRDKETGDIAIKASLTGHLVLSTLHTNDAISTITRLVNMGIPNYLITASLSLIVAQRLARKVCKSCAEVDSSVSPEQLKMIGFTPEEISQTTVYKGAGCKECSGTGYKGRQGIYEILQITPKLKQAIMDGKDAPELEEIALKDGFTTMQKVGRGFVQQGILSAAEYQRILIF